MAENEQAQPGEPQQPEEKPKIIVDDDWKAQARAEKEKLAEEAEKKAQAGGPRPGAPGSGPRQLPPPSFAALVNSLVTQTFLSLGGMEDPRTRRRYVDLDLAKHHIDTLVVLEEKTKGNLTDEEKKLLDQALYECRMQYVGIAQRVATAPRAPRAPQAPEAPSV
ncbi:MAG TPA: DUF1844 domain-containing protein [Phycisphaerae bacterium]|nr:DUF1844 domain-containing protein [Phycisphaerae bacterium]